jgi:hypothetical protein
MSGVLNLVDRTDVAAEIEVIDGNVYRSSFGIAYSAPRLVLPEVRLTQRPWIGQRYHIEIWIEKSTANDVLLSPARAYGGINVATFCRRGIRHGLQESG